MSQTPRWAASHRPSSPAPTSGSYCFLPKGRAHSKVAWADIHYVEACDKHCLVVTALAQYRVTGGLKVLLTLLPEDLLVRIHRSYLVNPVHICGLDTHQSSVMVGEKELPLGRTYRDDFLSSQLVIS